MRNAFGLMLASVVAAVVIAGVWFWIIPRALTRLPLKQLLPARPIHCRRRRRKAERRPRTIAVSGARCRAGAAPVAGAAEAGLRQSQCAGRRPRGRDRHHRRAGIRLRAFQAARFPHRQGSRADLRRRPVAGQHARRAEGAGGRMHQRHVLRGRQARDLSSRNPAQVLAAGHTVGTHTWSHVNLNSKKMTEQQAKDEIEKGFSAVRLALGTAAGAVLPLPAAAAPSGDGDLSRHPQRRDVLDRPRLLRLQGEATPRRSSKP